MTNERNIFSLWVTKLSNLWNDIKWSKSKSFWCKSLKLMKNFKLLVLCTNTSLYLLHRWQWMPEQKFYIKECLCWVQTWIKSLYCGADTRKSHDSLQSSPLLSAAEEILFELQPCISWFLMGPPSRGPCSFQIWQPTNRSAILLAWSWWKLTQLTQTGG